MTPVAKHFTRLFIGDLEMPNAASFVPGSADNPVAKFDMLIQAVVTGSVLQVFQDLCAAGITVQGLKSAETISSWA